MTTEPSDWCPPAKPGCLNEVWVHGGCPDGTAAGAIAKIFNPDINVISLYHGVRPSSPSGKHIAVFDFSFDDNTTRELLSQAASLSIYDHHKGQEKVLLCYPNNCVFDNSHSGAYLAWKYFFPEYPVPWWVLGIEDRDLWTHKLPYTKALSSYLFYSTPGTAATWACLFPDPRLPAAPGAEEELKRDIIASGSSYLVAECTLISTQVQGMKECMFCGYRAGVGNTSVLISDTCDAFLLSKPTFELAVVFRYNKNTSTWDFSIRSRAADNVDCIAIAKRFSGGGHKNASGFKIPITESVIDFITNNAK
jgi:oligoribonuclease NrnB/cAMP/cGMP phosphodiesterase (DHH superfamily)